MKRDETIQFLTLHGWEIYLNRPNHKVVLDKYYDPDIDEGDGWITIEAALELERLDNPDAVNEYELINGLDSKSFKVYQSYFDE